MRGGALGVDQVAVAAGGDGRVLGVREEPGLKTEKGSVISRLFLSFFVFDEFNFGGPASLMGDCCTNYMGLWLFWGGRAHYGGRAQRLIKKSFFSSEETGNSNSRNRILESFPQNGLKYSFSVVNEFSIYMAQSSRDLKPPKPKNFPYPPTPHRLHSRVPPKNDSKTRKENSKHDSGAQA